MACLFSSQLEPVPIYTAWWTEAQLAQGYTWRPELETATSRLQIRRPNHRATQYSNDKSKKSVIDFIKYNCISLLLAMTRVAGVKCSSLSLVCLSVSAVEPKQLKLQSPNLLWDSPLWVLASRLILGQKVKVTGSQNAKAYFRWSSGRREFALYRVTSHWLTLDTLQFVRMFYQKSVIHVFCCWGSSASGRPGSTYLWKAAKDWWIANIDIMQWCCRRPLRTIPVYGLKIDWDSGNTAVMLSTHVEQK